MSIPPISASPLTRESFAEREGVTNAIAPVRIVHIGLGAFHRAHQAWYTAQVDEAGEWGIAAFTGRNATAANELAPQEGLYTLIERSAERDVASVIPSIVEAVDGADLSRFVELLAASSTAIVTTTITEAGYRLTASAEPNLADAAVSADLDWLTSHLGETSAAFDGGPTTTLGRLVLGLHARRLAGGGPLAIVPCDNMPNNGDFVARGLTALAALADPETAAWIASNVSFVSTSVDRITPKTTAADIEAASVLSGWLDAAPVVTEPFRDWVLAGNFPAGRPAWERAGARFVDEIEPFERRKLWLLNGAHSLLAYAGRLRGHETVASAIADETCLGWVTSFWDDAARNLPEGLDLDAYRTSLLERFTNARIEHKLTQIGMDGVTKLRVRVVPVLLAERRSGREGAAGIRAIGSWLALVLSGAFLPDAHASQIDAALASADGVDEALLRLVDDRLVEDDDVFAAIRAVLPSRWRPGRSAQWLPVPVTQKHR
ncbi:mannitol dehydrogenase family protein [Mycetocola sp. 2940]|uniref:mannitol dehydrogenase family protein n=1 Tax=Mycetocola sp. 2940 TaxID=3156452 RepID=UPI0033943D08